MAKFFFRVIDILMCHRQDQKLHWGKLIAAIWYRSLEMIFKRQKYLSLGEPALIRLIGGPAAFRLRLSL